MNLTKKILIIAPFFIVFNIFSGELTSLLQEQLTRDPANIVERYLYDGTLKLNPKYNSDSISRMELLLTEDQKSQCYSIIKLHYSYNSYQELQNLKEHSKFVPIIYTIPDQHLPKNTLLTAIPEICIKDKIVGDRILVKDAQGKQYDFKLEEDKKANMEEIAKWENLGKELIVRGFIGNHAQMERLMRIKYYIISNFHDIAKIKESYPIDYSEYDKSELRCWNYRIDWIIHGNE